MESKSNNKKTIALLLNIAIPIITGGIIYYVMSPDVLFVKIIDSFVGSGLHISGIDMENMILRFIRNYFLDMLWGYALVFALFLVLGNDTADLKKILTITLSFTMAMELLQLFSVVRGTFDVCDIAVMFLAEIIAVFVIRNFIYRRNSY